jgi:predicted transcriptional regulator
MINRAIYDQLIKKEIALVEDILIPREKTNYLTTSHTVEKWHELNSQTGHSRYPVVDNENKLYGMVTSKDVIGVSPFVEVEKVMTKSPIAVSPKTSVASSAHMMVWEGIELLPVIDQNKKLVGIISRQDVLKALQMLQRQPHVGETIEDLVTRHMEDVSSAKEVCYQLEVNPQMTNHLGTISYGVITTIVTEAGSRALRKYKKGDLVVENITLFFIKPVQIESEILIVPRVLEVGRKFAKVDVELFYGGQIVGKAMLMAQLIDR